MKTDHYRCLESGLRAIDSKISSVDDLLLRLLFANLITLLEVYLQSVMYHLVEHDQKLLINVAKSKKFKARKVPIHFALASDPRRYMLQLIGEINFHNLSDVEPLYREAFSIKIPIKDETLKMIRLRHDVVHRNGFTKEGTPVRINADILKEAADSIRDLTETVDRKLLEIYAPLFTK